MQILDSLVASAVVSDSEDSLDKEIDDNNETSDPPVIPIAAKEQIVLQLTRQLEDLGSTT